MLVSDKTGHRVIVRGKGVHKMSITLVAPVTPANGDRTVAFPSAGAPVSRLSFAVPGEGVRVTVQPNLATTRTDEGSGVTRVMAYVGAARELRLTWRPRPVETVGAEAVVHAQTEVLHRVGEQTIETYLYTWYSALGEADPALTFDTRTDTELEIPSDAEPGTVFEVIVALRDGRGGLDVARRELTVVR